MIGLNLILSTDICVPPLGAGTMSAELIRVYPIKPGKQVMSIQTIVWRRKKSFFLLNLSPTAVFFMESLFYFGHSEAYCKHLKYFVFQPCPACCPKDELEINM